MKTYSLKTLALVDELSPWADLEVTGISLDSRTIKSGDLFIALDGAHFKGSDFIPKAVESGAVAVLVAATSISLPETSAPVLAVADLQQRVGELASQIYGYPSQQLKVIGITGTNGKTSCAHFIAQGLEYSGIRTALVGTVGNGLWGQLETATHTTPDAVSLQKMLAGFLAEGAKAVVMEVSSHALQQGRVAGVQFDVAACTNLSRDHLDYHGSMAAYGAAKARLFLDFSPAVSLLNQDDGFCQELAGRIRQAGGAPLFFGLSQGEYHLEQHLLSDQGMALTLQLAGEQVTAQVPLLGGFNLSNLLLSAGVLHQLGLPVHLIAEALVQLIPVAGRMERLTCPAGATVVVDYAHTPDALEKALKACREHTDGQVWVVFGCGGDRDTGKRAEMASTAEQLADRVVVTSDNPRTEAPDQIIEMILQGMKQPEQALVQSDRRQAIIQAVQQAASGDLILVAGKGHEDYQDIQGVKHPFSDKAVVQQAFASLTPLGMAQEAHP